MSENISLEKSKQSRFAKKIKNVKKQVASGEIIVKEDVGKAKRETERGVVYLGHIPHGFYEKEMRAYLSQFGKVLKLAVCRSHRTGRSKGFAFVEFVHDDVAKIVAETMHNYLMFNRRLIAEYIPFEKRPPGLFKGKATTEKNYTLKRRRNTVNRQKNTNLNGESYLKRTQRQMMKLKSKMNKLKELGVDYDFKPVDVPGEISKETVIEQQQKPKKQKNLSEKTPKCDLVHEDEYNSKLIDNERHPKKSKSVPVKKEKKTSKNTTENRLQNKTSDSNVKTITKLSSVTKKKDTIKSLPANKKLLKLATETVLNTDFSKITKGNKKMSSTTTKRLLRERKTKVEK